MCINIKCKFDIYFYVLVYVFTYMIYEYIHSHTQDSGHFCLNGYSVYYMITKRSKSSLYNEHS